MTQGTIKFEGEKYDWSAEPCDDCDDLAVYLDLGNGNPECIGYAEDADEAKELVREELAKLSEA
jgi:hypothetical protein